MAVGANRTLASYAYGASNGNLQTMTYGNGDAISYTYDTLGRVCTATYKNTAGDTTRVLTYTYTGDGQLYAIHDSATENTTYYTYDSLGRLISSNNGDVYGVYTYNAYNQLTRYRFTSPVLGDGTQTYTYDTNTTNGYSDGMLTGMTMVSGHSTIYTYDSLQRLTQRHINSGKTGGGMWDCYTYRDGSATNTTTTRVHSKENWLNSSIRTNSLYFEYDVIGNITKETRHTYSIPASSKIAQNVADRTVSTIHYTYDSLGQLTGVTHSDGRTEAYTYDKAGNILTFNNGSGISHTLSYTDSQWKDLLTAVDGQSITYDAIGNPTNYYDGSTMAWAEGRRLQSVTQNGQTHSYQYNADGLRIKKTNPDGTYIVYHIADGRYVGETHYNALSQRVKYLRYTYDENDRVCGIGVWYAGQSQAWEEYYFETNLQGDVIAVYTAANGTNELPQLVASYTYDAWGNILTSTGSLADLNPFRYRGYYYDAEMGLYYVSSRYYDPEIGRFINADGFVSTGQDITGYNMFAYCGNNPANYHDTLGTRHEISAGVGIQNCEDAVSQNSSFLEDLLIHMVRPRQEGNTFSVGLAGGGNAGDMSNGVSYVLSADTSYNYAIQKTAGYGGTVGYGSSGGLVMTYTNANNVHDLEGASDAVGVTLVSLVGVTIDYITFSPDSDPNKTCWGLNVVISLGGEADVHAMQNYTSTLTSWNPLIGLKKLLYGE